MSEIRESDSYPLTTAKEGVVARVASGRGGFLDILQQARRILVDVLPEGTDPEGPEAREALSRLPDHVDTVLAGHVHRQRRWPSRVDGERLSRAFRALDESGIIAREDFHCCDPCARASLNGLLDVYASDPSGTPVRGYAFYNNQETGVAAGTGLLMIGFDSGHPIRRAAVGEEVAEVLRAHGLTVEWDGDPDGKLRVPTDWNRRRWDRGAAFPGPAVDGEPGVEVSFNDPGPYPVPEWITHYEGRVSVRELSRMVLPWLPSGFVATLRGDHGHTIEIGRGFDLLCVRHGPVLSRERVEEPLSRWAVGSGWPRENARSPHTGMLDVTYSDTAEEGFGSVDYAEPMEAAAARHLVYRLTPAKGTFAVFAAHGGEVVQMMWETGPRLWMESPLPAESMSRGRHVALPEAEEMVRVLADEGRVALDELGELSVTRW